MLIAFFCIWRRKLCKLRFICIFRQQPLRVLSSKILPSRETIPVLNFGNLFSILYYGTSPESYTREPMYRFHVDAITEPESDRHSTDRYVTEVAIEFKWLFLVFLNNYPQRREFLCECLA